MQCQVSEFNENFWWSESTGNSVEQVFYEVAKFDKRSKLEELMQDPERDPKERTLIFVQTKKNADFLATYLSGEGLPTTSIHGDR